MQSLITRGTAPYALAILEQWPVKTGQLKSERTTIESIGLGDDRGQLTSKSHGSKSKLDRVGGNIMSRELYKNLFMGTKKADWSASVTGSPKNFLSPT